MSEGFNELVTRWYGDHVYKHDDSAMLSACGIPRSLALRRLSPRRKTRRRDDAIARFVQREPATR